MKEVLITQESLRLSRVDELASKFRIKIIGTGYAVGCPAIENPFDTTGIEISWASLAPYTVEGRLFTQFEKALNAVESARDTVEYGAGRGDNYFRDKELYTELNVYGRVMFIDIVKQMECFRKADILLTLARYPEECLDFDALCYDRSTKVVEIYKAHIAPTIDTWVEQIVCNPIRMAELEKRFCKDSSENFSKALKPINFNLIQDDDDREIRDEPDLPQAVELVANEAFPVTDQ